MKLDFKQSKCLFLASCLRTVAFRDVHIHSVHSSFPSLVYNSVLNKAHIINMNKFLNNKCKLYPSVTDQQLSEEPEQDCRTYMLNIDCVSTRLVNHNARMHACT